MATIIYSVKISIRKDVEPAWINYMKKHILDVVNTQCFRDYHIRKVLPIILDNSEDDGNFITYIIEYYANSIQKLEEYFANYAEALQKEHSEKFKGQYTASRIIMEDQFSEWFHLSPVGSYKFPDDIF